ncbi:MAG TPA: RagB/SusD family nutrient uptake outer membrane protein [Gemmatimonadaceae bacterium]|nr:RagB/SusD family nutrient uptake outer membrane protein [Gemmatimonadaceae bacterium]
MSLHNLRVRAGRLALQGIAGVSLLVGCSGALDVPNPQAFGDDALNDPIILKTVADGAEGSLHQAYDDMITVADLNSDVMESTSTWIDWEDISEGRLRHDWPTGGSFSGPQDALLRARFAAQSAKERIERVLEGQAATSPLRAQVMLVDALADLLIGMGWCEGPLNANSARAPDTEFFKQAVTKFTEGLTAAQAVTDVAAKAKWTNVAYAGRARANLLAGNYAAARTDAQAVTAGFQYDAVFQELAQSTPGNQFHQNRNRSGGLRRMYHARVHSIDSSSTGSGEAYMRDWFDPTKDDRRMAITRRAGQLGVNNRFPYYGITKYRDRTAPIRMLSKIEATLIEAEVAMRNNDFATFATLINSLRTRAGVALPAIPTPTSAAEATNALLNERMAELFVEGHRQQDLYRFNMTRTLLGTGKATKLPLSRNEILNNTNMTDGGGTCPSVS